jgi:hypothetical protein
VRKAGATHSLAVLAAIPAFVGGLVAVKTGAFLLGGAAILAGVPAMALILTFLIPLERGEG